MELQEILFKDFVTLQRGFDLPSRRRREGPYPVVASTSLVGWHDEYKVLPPGVTTGRSGSLGSVIFLDEPFWPLNTTLWVRDFKDNDPRYVYYHLQMLGLERFNSGAGVPTLNRNHLDQVVVRVHEKPDQERIAGILSTYDDLIKNNTRRIEILEEMAQAIYHEWFVNFHFPGHEEVELVESELGLIPRAWEVGPFRELANLKRDSVNPSDYSDEVFDYYSFSAFDESQRPEQSEGKEIKSTKYLAHPGCVLLSKLNPRIPRVWMPSISGSHRPIASTEFLVLTPTERSTPSYLFETCRSKEFLGRFRSLAGGTSTSHQRVKPNDFLELKVSIPPLHLISRFTELTGPVHDLMRTLGKMRILLKETRDLLLPKLVSGEIDVTDLDIDTSRLSEWQAA